MSSRETRSMPRRLWKACLLATLMSLVGVTVGLAASGSLDTTFSGDGKLVMNIVAGQSSEAQGVAIQPDGKIVVVGNTWPVLWSSSNIVVTRLTKSGVLDPTFNGTGKRVVDFGTNSSDRAESVVIDPVTGKIIVSGGACKSTLNYCNLFVLRFNANGTWDTTFNGTGKFLDNYGLRSLGSLGGLALQSDGKIVVAGRVLKPATSDEDFAVYRLTPAGALDTTFNGTGRQSIGFGAGRIDIAEALTYSPATGQIIIAGATCESFYYNCNIAVARLNANGSLNNNFSGDGKQSTNLGGNDVATGVALRSGKIVVVGYKGISGDTQWYTAVVRYNADGSLDTTFAGTGKKLLNIGGQLNSVALAVNTQGSAGKIVTCGRVGSKVTLLRLTAAGALDTTFHGTGIDTTGITGGCYALSTQPADNKYVVAGYSGDASARQWTVARVLP